MLAQIMLKKVVHTSNEGEMCDQSHKKPANFLHLGTFRTSSWSCAARSRASTSGMSASATILVPLRSFQMV